MEGGFVEAHADLRREANRVVGEEVKVLEEEEDERFMPMLVNTRVRRERGFEERSMQRARNQSAAARPRSMKAKRMSQAL